MTQQIADGPSPKAAGAKRKRGRPKGSLNKLTRSVRDAILLAAEGLGGPERLVAWAKENPKNEAAFWTSIYPKLLPLQVTGDPANPISHVHRMERLIVDPAESDRKAIRPLIEQARDEAQLTTDISGISLDIRNADV